MTAETAAVNDRRNTAPEFPMYECPQFGQVSPEMGRTENPKMPEFGNQPPRGLAGGLEFCTTIIEGTVDPRGLIIYAIGHV